MDFDPRDDAICVFLMEEDLVKKDTELVVTVTLCFSVCFLHFN
jgi:hypothetical protein